MEALLTALSLNSTIKMVNLSHNEVYTQSFTAAKQLQTVSARSSM